MMQLGLINKSYRYAAIDILGVYKNYEYIKLKLSRRIEK